MRRRQPGPYRQLEPRRCELCAVESIDVIQRPVRWDDWTVKVAGLRRYETVLRCPHVDDQACRARVESAGGTWHVDDAITRPTVKPAPVFEEVPV